MTPATSFADNRPRERPRINSLNGDVICVLQASARAHLTSRWTASHKVSGVSSDTETAPVSNVAVGESRARTPQRGRSQWIASGPRIARSSHDTPSSEAMIAPLEPTRSQRTAIAQALSIQGVQQTDPTASTRTISTPFDQDTTSRARKNSAQSANNSPTANTVVNTHEHLSIASSFPAISG